MTSENGRGLAAQARALGMKSVGVFRDSPAADVIRAAQALRLDAVQLHGHEDAGELRARLPRSVELWALCGVEVHRAADPRPGADRTLFDTATDGASGGTGEAFDWSLLGGRDDLGRSFIAGGIGPANAAAAARLGAYGIDVNSAVEVRPGEKDRAKVAALFATLRPGSRSDR